MLQAEGFENIPCCTKNTKWINPAERYLSAILIKGSDGWHITSFVFIGKMTLRKSNDVQMNIKGSKVFRL